MGRLLNGPNGPFVGKAGSYIGYTVNGVGYIKGLYKRRTKAPTEKEALNREKFAVAQHWLQPLLQSVRIGFKGYNEKFQGFAAAKSYLMNNAMEVLDGKIIINPELVKVSSGSLPLPKNIECTFQEPGTFCFNWTPDIGTDREAQTIAVVYDLTNKQNMGFTFGSSAYSGKYEVYIGNPSGKTYLIYLAFVAADRSRQSDSIYLGRFDF
ncbi:MAG: DUF6266 family protein [Bacteroidota bacterium]